MSEENVERRVEEVTSGNSFPTSSTRHSSLVTRLERGEDTSFEFAIWIVPLCFMVCLIVFATYVRGAQMPVWTAASECTRQAIASLDAGQGVGQALRTARRSLIGNALNGTAATVSVNIGSWSRGQSVTCNVRYNLDVSNIPLIGAGIGSVPVVASVTSRVENYKSGWK